MPRELICVIVPCEDRRGVCGTSVILPAIENAHFVADRYVDHIHFLEWHVYQGYFANHYVM